MFNVLTKVLSTDTIILHYKELDTALNAYYFFRDEFYAKSKKAPVIPEDEEDYWTKSLIFKNTLKVLLINNFKRTFNALSKLYF